MTTQYQCHGCGSKFSGINPVVFGEFAEPVYPTCPNGIQIFVGKGPWDPAAILSANARDHPVSLAVTKTATAAAASAPAGPIPVPYPTLGAAPPPAQPAAGAWGQPRVLVADTPQQALQRKRQAALDKIASNRRRAEEQANTDAQRLVNNMELAIGKKDGSVSSNFPKDLQYGTKDSGKLSRATADVIRRASVIWRAKGAGYAFRAPKFKIVWGLAMANFEKLRVAGDASGGKHNFHVVPHPTA